MGITIALDLAALAESAITDAHREASAAGALDPESVWFEYVTMHDDRVRPSHAALDGTTWRIDDPLAPVPPIGYNCRCAMRYVGKPATVAASVLPAAKVEPLPMARVFANALDASPVDNWKTLARQVVNVRPDLRFATLQSELRNRFDAADAQEYARMILQAATTLPSE